jgi:hypothetical protein
MTTTSTKRPPRASKLATVPFSATAAWLIEQILAEARATLLADLSAKDAVVVLHGFDAQTKQISVYSTSINVRDDSGNRVSLHRHLTEPKQWRGHSHMAGYWHPARWYGQQTLVDMAGRKWERDLGAMVCDDFGNLVQVAA